MLGNTPMCSYVYFLTAFLSSYMLWDHRHCSRQQRYIMEPLRTNYCWRLLCSKYLAMKTRHSKPHFPHRYVSIYFYIFYDFLCFTWDWPNFHTTVHACTENHQQTTHVSKQQWAMRTGAETTLLLWSRILTVCNNRPMLYCYQQSLGCSGTTLGAVARMSCQKPRLLSERFWKQECWGISKAIRECQFWTCLLRSIWLIRSMEPYSVPFPKSKPTYPVSLPSLHSVSWKTQFMFLLLPLNFLHQEFSLSGEWLRSAPIIPGKDNSSTTK